MNNSDIVVRYVTLVVLLTFAGGVFLSGDTFDWSWVRFFSLATIVSAIGLVVFDQFLWRLPLLQRLQKVPRNLRGTWRGDLVSYWVDPDTGERIAPKVCYLVIRQTASRMSAVLMTDESKSRSTSAVLDSVDAQWTLAYMYLNKPGMSVHERSKMHHGSTILEVSGLPAGKLEGRYWTDRDSRGELFMKQRSKRLADDYQGAVELFSE